MKALPKTAKLLQVARRVMWFEEPERALADPRRLCRCGLFAIDPLLSLLGAPYGCAAQSRRGA